MGNETYCFIYAKVKEPIGKLRISIPTNVVYFGECGKDNNHVTVKGRKAGVKQIEQVILPDVLRYASGLITQEDLAYAEKNATSEVLKSGEQGTYKIPVDKIWDYREPDAEEVSELLEFFESKTDDFESFREYRNRETAK